MHPPKTPSSTPACPAHARGASRAAQPLETTAGAAAQGGEAAADHCQPTLGQALKIATQDQHDAAEKHPFHAVLFGAEGVFRAREAYARSLGQHLHIQQTFEPLLRRAESESGAIRSMVRPYHYHLDALRDDLAAVGAPPEYLTALPATARFTAFIESCAAQNGCALLGVWYVFEGSTNGGTIIAKRIRDLLGLPDDRGTRFTNPHGPQVRSRWTEWKMTLDSLHFDQAQQLAVIDAARLTFNAISEVMTDVQAALGPAPALPEVVFPAARERDAALPRRAES